MPKGRQLTAQRRQARWEGLHPEKDVPIASRLASECAIK